MISIVGMPFIIVKENRVRDACCRRLRGQAANPCCSLHCAASWVELFVSNSYGDKCSVLPLSEKESDLSHADKGDLAGMVGVHVSYRSAEVSSAELPRYPLPSLRLHGTPAGS